MVKLVKDEPETGAIRAFISATRLVGSELLLTEVPRALRGAPPSKLRLGLDVALGQADVFLDGTDLYPIGPLGLRRAGRIFDPRLRALDAIHVATALEIKPLWVFVTYDERQAEAAHEAGLRVRSPGK
jgi:uncharacterized protein